MAYASSNAAVRLIQELGLYNVYSSSGAAISDGGRTYSYCSSHAATDITATGFFSACGSPRGYGILVKSTNNVGMNFGDLLVNIESSAGASPGRVTWHCVVGSSFNQASTSASTAWVSSAGFDVTVSAHAST